MEALKNKVYFICKVNILVCHLELGHHNGEEGKQVCLVWRKTRII